jgi:hypothetical protein
MKRMQRLGFYSLICAAICATYALETEAQPPRLEGCDTWERELSKDDLGHTVWLIEEGCSGFSNGARVAIAISKSAGVKTTFFKFEDVSWNAAYHGQTTPSVKWIAPNYLEVSIGAIADVEKKLDRVGDVIITYKIGHVLER